MNYMNHGNKPLTPGFIKKLIIGITLCFLISPAFAVTSENAIIYDLPLFDNYGPAFATWSGSDKPLGNALLKGTITLDKNQYNPGDKVKIKLDLVFSATIIAGTKGALMHELGYDTWMLDTSDFLGFDVELGQIEGEEYMGIGNGQEIPPLMMRNISHTYYYDIPDSAIPGTYNVNAYIENSDYKTNPVTITIGNAGKTIESYTNEGLSGFSGLVLSKDFNEETGEPISISDVFSQKDKRICALVSFDSIPSDEILGWNWYDPNGDYYITDTLLAEKGWDWACYYIDIKDYEEALIPGVWTIDFLHNEEVLDTKTFTWVNETLNQ